ncbi:MAG: PAS domain S-box protein [Rhodospirillaceae bacterium]|nr:PAS domain S-box protein [Rhodospirillaceae bacterium]
MSERHGDTVSADAGPVDAANPGARNRDQQILDLLEASLVHYAKIIELSTDAIVTVDDTGRITHFSAGAERMFGYAADRIIGRPLDILIPKRLRKRHRAHIAAFVSGDGVTRHMGQRGEISARRRGGTEFPAEASIMQYELHGKRVLTAILRDVSDRVAADIERRDAYRQADLANRAKSDFLANMSHELRTPLNAIIGFTEVMTRETFGPLGSDRYRGYCKDIGEAGRHLLSLINDILDVAKIEAGELRPVEREVDVADAIRACLRMVRERVEAAGLSVRTEIARLLPLLHCDERLLKQMLLNLLSNAIKFTPAGAVTVRARLADNGDLRIEVADTGIGIASSDITKALQPFGQVDSTVARKFGGTGLGLHLVRIMVELHSGHLELKSTPGTGTVAILTFPAARLRPDTTREFAEERARA